jgi:hypothetical protein
VVSPAVRRYCPKRSPVTLRHKTAPRVNAAPCPPEAPRTSHHTVGGPDRGDLVRLETFFAEDGRLCTRRDWHITDATTGAYLGAATRCAGWMVAKPGAGGQVASSQMVCSKQHGASRLCSWPWPRRRASRRPAPHLHRSPPHERPAPLPRRPPSCLRSTWVTINSETRKLSKLPEEVRTRWLNLSPSPPRIVLPVGETKRKLEDFPEDAALVGPVVSARRTDMDPNGHINNVCYMSWALEAVPRHVYNGYHLREVRGGHGATLQGWVGRSWRGTRSASGARLGFAGAPTPAGLLAPALRSPRPWPAPFLHHVTPPASPPVTCRAGGDGLQGGVPCGRSGGGAGPPPHGH